MVRIETEISDTSRKILAKFLATNREWTRTKTWYKLPRYYPPITYEALRELHVKKIEAQRELIARIGELEREILRLQNSSKS